MYVYVNINATYELPQPPLFKVANLLVLILTLLLVLRLVLMHATSVDSRVASADANVDSSHAASVDASHAASTDATVATVDASHVATVTILAMLCC